MECQFCKDTKLKTEFKESELLERFMEHGKILSRRLTGNCPEHQREITLAIRRARVLGLIT